MKAIWEKRVWGWFLSMVMVFIGGLWTPCRYANADASVNTLFTTFCTGAVTVLYLEDGRILFAPMDGVPGDRKLERIECMDGDGNHLWTCSLPVSAAVEWARLKLLPDGTFAMTGRLLDGSPYVLFIGGDGQYLEQMTLPDNANVPALVSDGVYYSTSDTDGVCLWKMDWSGDVRELNLPWATGLMLDDVIEGKRTFLKFFYGNAQDKLISAVLCLNESGEVAWRYDAGPFAETVILQWTSNDLGGVTLQTQHSTGVGTVTSRIVCLDGEGKTVWTSELSSAVKYLRAHVMEQSEDGNYYLWGHGGLPRAQNLDIKDNISFGLTLDREGNYLSSEFKAGWCVSHTYIDGEIYATVYSDDQTALYQVPFSSLESVQMEPIQVTRK